MGDLISRSALLNRLEAYGNSKYKTDYNDGWDDARNEITLVVKHSEAVDAELVQYGKWIWDNNAIDWNIGAWVCNKCRMRNENIHAGAPGIDNTFGFSPYNWAGSRFCPNCGAKMRGDEYATD